MSLSFVSRSIQTQGNGGNYEEERIEGAEADTSAQRINNHQLPLFDQLRTNKEREDEEREEQQRSMMRGTLALDEDDAAYLGVLQAERSKAESQKQAELEEQLAFFHAAKMEKMEAENDTKSAGNRDASVEANQQPTSRTEAAIIIPKFIVKKRRRLDTDAGDERFRSIERQSAGDGPVGIGSLLSEYGSDSSGADSE
jgi:hypothetical protein